MRRPALLVHHFPVPRYLLRIAYDGTGYVGWQRQLNGVSVQQRLEEAAAGLAGGTVVVTGAGRTDAGVHALGQTAHLDLPRDEAGEVVARALNNRLPPDIRVRHASQVADDVHARFSATGKTYRYRWLVSAVGHPLLERDAWRVGTPLDVAEMRRAARHLVGTHDFACFQSAGTDVQSTVRTLSAVRLHGATPRDRRLFGLDADEDRLDLVLEGTGFLRHMVRAIAGTLTDIGRGRWPASRMTDILAARDRGLAGPNAPPHGLTLVQVGYPPGVATRSEAEQPP